MVRASASRAADSEFDSESGQTNNFKSAIHISSALRLAFRAEQAGKFTWCVVGKGTKRDSPCWCGRQVAGDS